MRDPNWKVALREYIDAARGSPFAYGEFDCALFAAGAVKVMTGIDYAEAFGAYDAARARELLLEYGGIAGLVTGIFGEPVAPNLCHDGDVVEIDTTRGPALGICLGVNVACAGPRGVSFRPRSLITRGWKVP